MPDIDWTEFVVSPSTGRNGLTAQVVRIDRVHPRYIGDPGKFSVTAEAAGFSITWECDRIGKAPLVGELVDVRVCQHQPKVSRPQPHPESHQPGRTYQPGPIARLFGARP